MNENTDMTTPIPELTSEVEVSKNTATGECATAESAAAPEASAKARYGAIAGFVLMLVAWVVLFVNEWVSLSFCILAIVGCMFGCMQARSNLRNLAITGLIASGVLLVDIIIMLSIICAFGAM